MCGLKDKVILVTGGTSGIGKACVKKFVDEGAQVIFTGRKNMGGGVVDRGCADYFCADVTDDTALNALFNYVKDRYDRLDGLVNNAGIYPISPDLKDLSREFCSNIFNVNLSGLIMVAKIFMPLLIKSHGVLVNNASIAGVSGFTPNTSYAYSASKSGVIKFTQMIAKQYGKEIRANAICPGTIETPIFKNFDKVQTSVINKIPMGRTGTSDEVAKVVKFLLSDDASYINGAVITIDGGQSL